MHFVLLVSLLALISPGQFLAATSGMGTPHVTASTWTLEPVAYSGGGSPPRLAVDSMGIPHVFYCPPGDERYATRTLSGWTSEHVVSTAFGGGCGEFVMGRDDVPRITTGVVPIGSPCELYGVRVNETWAFECFPGGLMDGVDSRGRPHVATYWTISSNRYDLRHLWRDANGTWAYETVEANALNAYPVLLWYSITLDSRDEPRILYYDSVRGDVRYAFRDAAGWHVEVVEHVGDIEYIGMHGSLALAPDGTPQAAYWAFVDFARNEGSLRYAVRGVSGWSIQTVEGPPGMKGRFPTIATDAGGTIHVADIEWNVLNPANYSFLADLRYGTLRAGIWTWDTIIAGYQYITGSYYQVRLPDFPSMAVDRCGNPHIAFYYNVIEGLDTSQRGVYYATKGDPCAPTRKVALNLTPNNLNPKSKGRWVTAFLSTDNASVADIDARTLRLNGVAVGWSTTLWNHTLMAKFDRAAFAATLAPSDAVMVTLTGRWADGGTFTATDTIRVIRPGR